MDQWYYAHDGKQSGPVPISELQRLAANGDFDPEKDLVWQEGLPDWKPATMVPELSSLTNPGASAATPAAASAGSAPAGGASANPYAAPSSDVTSSTGSGISELPYVKPTNFTLFAILYAFGAIGFCVGYGIFIASMITAGNNGEPESTAAMAGGGILALSMIPFLIGTIMGMIYLYRAWVLLQPHTQHSTPGKAVGFLFIPFYNLYWMFVAYWRWSQEWNRLVAMNPAHPQAPRANEGLFLTYCILQIAAVLFGILALIPIVVVFLIMMKSVCSAVNYAAQSHSR
ncbi:MAG: GYF domain-containing protein [Verrucomicrobiota bacterium]